MSVEGYKGDDARWIQMMTTKAKYIGVGIGYDYSMHCYWVFQEFASYDPTRALDYNGNN